MSRIELFLIAIGLSMDAFAVATCRGLKMKKINIKHALFIALCFGFFQAAMPLLGWGLGSQFRSAIEQYDHWVALILLSIIGGKMIYEGNHMEEESAEEECLKPKELLIMGIATSIDALAVGISFAVLPGIPIGSTVVLIGLTTFVISFAGVLMGHKVGTALKSKAEIVGGLILIVIGIRIVVEHLL